MGEEKKDEKQKDVKAAKTSKTSKEVKDVKVEKEVKVEQKTTAKKEPEKKVTEKKKTVGAKDKKETKERNIIISVVSILAVVVIIIGITLMSIASTPKKSVEAMLSSLKAGDFKNAGEFVNFSELMNISEVSGSETINEEAQKLFFDHLTWKITKVTENQEQANVELEVTNKDFKVIIGNYMQKALKAAFSGETVTEEELIEELRNEEAQTTTQTMTIQATKQDGKWVVVVNDDLVNLLLPGLQESINSVS